MTTAEMKAARARGETQSDIERIRREAAAAIEPAEDDDSPDASALMRQAIAERRRAGRPMGSGTKEQVAIRLDRDLLAAFRAEGPGWQTRINAALRQWLSEHPRETAKNG